MSTKKENAPEPEGAPIDGGKVVDPSSCKTLAEVLAALDAYRVWYAVARVKGRGVYTRERFARLKRDHPGRVRAFEARIEELRPIENEADRTSRIAEIRGELAECDPAEVEVRRLNQVVVDLREEVRVDLERLHKTKEIAAAVKQVQACAAKHAEVRARSLGLMSELVDLEQPLVFKSVQEAVVARDAFRASSAPPVEAAKRRQDWLEWARLDRERSIRLLAHERAIQSLKVAAVPAEVPA